MIREYYEAICNGVDVRANLIALRNALKDEKEIRAFAYLLGGDFSVLGSLLAHEDPKVRKNAAILLGKMESEDLLPLLFETYQKEETRFIRSDYLKAMEHMDYTPYLGELQERLQELRSVQAAPEEQKHVSEEIRMLQTMVLKYQKPEAHRFTAMDQAEDVILVTNKEQSAVTAHKFPAGCCRRLKGGVRVNGVPMREILSIRTYTELLFPIDAETLPQSDPELTGRRLGGDSEQANSLTKRMQRMHSGTGPYRFRIELKSRMEASKKGVYIRKLSDALERASKGMWINSATDYEAEVRLLERKDGGFTPEGIRFIIDRAGQCGADSGACDEVFKGERPDSGSVLRRRDDADRAEQGREGKGDVRAGYFWRSDREGTHQCTAGRVSDSVY